MVGNTRLLDSSDVGRPADQRCPGNRATLLPSTAHMRAAAVFGLGCSERNLRPFQTDKTIEWRIGVPADADKDQADVILIFGGDGTIHRHLSKLVKLELPVLVVPAGSGNDFAGALGLRHVHDSLAVWQEFCAGRGTAKAIDLGFICPLSGNAGGAPAPHPRTYFCSVAGVGLDAEVARRAHALPRWLRAHGGYALTLIPTIFRFAPFSMKILAPDGAGHWSLRSDQPTILAAFANTRAYGGGMKIAPRARMDDGQLDVCVIGGIDPFKLACMFPTVYFGRHLRIREVDYFQAPRLRVETHTPLDIYADGEYVCQTPAEVGVECGALRMIVHPSQTGF
ncbi:MAG: diacylglycerol kinase family protein [Candidatus Sulfotelmatobacter sp.]